MSAAAVRFCSGVAAESTPMKRGLKLVHAGLHRRAKAGRREHPDEEGTETSNQAPGMPRGLAAAESTPMKRGLKRATLLPEWRTDRRSRREHPDEEGTETTRLRHASSSPLCAAESTPMKRCCLSRNPTTCFSRTFVS